MRITSRGKIVACLHDDKHFDLSHCWNGKKLDTQTADRLLRQAVDQKPEVGPRGQSLTMLSLGG
jgi:molybdenum cofactor biosynthesis enzyme MoaA